MFNQVLVPGHNLAITVLYALIPLVVLLCLLAVFRMTAWLATLIASIVTIPLGVLVWKADFGGTMRAYFYGSLQGIWEEIHWITFWAW